MSIELTLGSAFLIGLLGSTHCIGMCGGIVGALALSARTRSFFLYLIAYNLGRILSYAVAGGVLGFVGAQVLQLTPDTIAGSVGRFISGGFMIALGLYLTGWWIGLGALEKAGAMVWRRIEPLGRRLLPIRNPLHALLVGLLWGWLPCGMVYSVLAWSLVSGDTLHGAALMAAFGVGTLPMLLAMGVMAQRLNELARRPWLRRLAGILILLFGVYTLTVSKPAAHHHAFTPALGVILLARP